jgi:hypothetical protein
MSREGCGGNEGEGEKKSKESEEKGEEMGKGGYGDNNKEK